MSDSEGVCPIHPEDGECQMVWSALLREWVYFCQLCDRTWSQA